MLGGMGDNGTVGADRCPPVIKRQSDESHPINSMKWIRLNPIPSTWLPLDDISGAQRCAPTPPIDCLDCFYNVLDPGPFPPGGLPACRQAGLIMDFRE